MTNGLTDLLKKIDTAGNKNNQIDTAEEFSALLAEVKKLDVDVTAAGSIRVNGKFDAALSKLGATSEQISSLKTIASKIATKGRDGSQLLSMKDYDASDKAAVGTSLSAPEKTLDELKSGNDAYKAVTDKDEKTFVDANLQEQFKGKKASEITEKMTESVRTARDAYKIDSAKKKDEAVTAAIKADPDFQKINDKTKAAAVLVKLQEKFKGKNAADIKPADLTTAVGEAGKAYDLGLKKEDPKPGPVKTESKKEDTYSKKHLHTYLTGVRLESEAGKKLDETFAERFKADEGITAAEFESFMNGTFVKSQIINAGTQNVTIRNKAMDGEFADLVAGNADGLFKASQLSIRATDKREVADLAPGTYMTQSQAMAYVKSTGLDDKQTFFSLGLGHKDTKLIKDVRSFFAQGNTHMSIKQLQDLFAGSKSDRAQKAAADVTAANVSSVVRDLKVVPEPVAKKPEKTETVAKNEKSAEVGVSNGKGQIVAAGGSPALNKEVLKTLELPTMKTMLATKDEVVVDEKTKKSSPVAASTFSYVTIPALFKDVGIDFEKMPSPNKDMNMAQYIADVKDGAAISKEIWEKGMKKFHFDKLGFTYTEYTDKTVGNDLGTLINDLRISLKTANGNPVCPCSDASAAEDYLKAQASQA